MAKGKSGNNLHRAASKGELDTVGLILESGVDVNQRTFGVTPLHNAAQSGQTDMVGLLLDYGANIDEPNMVGRTALHLAAWKGHADTIAVLLDRGASVHIRDRNGRTPRDLAEKDRQTEVASLLAGREAEANAADAAGQAVAASENAEIAELLAGREAEANAADAAGQAVAASENDLIPPSSWVDQIGKCYRCGESPETCFSTEIIACNGSSRSAGARSIKTTYKDFTPVVLSVCDSCIVKEKLRWRKTAKIGTVLFAISLSIIIALLIINVEALMQIGVPLVLLLLLLPGFGMSLFGWGFSYLYVRLQRAAESNDIALFEKISKNMNETSLKIIFPDLNERISDMTGRNCYLTLGAYEALKRKNRVTVN